MAWMVHVIGMLKRHHENLDKGSHLDGLGSEEVVQTMVGSLVEEEEQMHDHLQVLVYHPHLQGNLGEGPHGTVDCVAGALRRWGGLEDDLPEVFDLHRAEAVAAELSVSE